MALLPTGLVTFLFTDIEGSTQRWDRTPDAMRLALISHDALLEDVILAHNGAIFKRVGDAFCAAFAAADRALAAALTIQRALAAATWTDVEALRVRIALHSGTSDERNADYFGPTVNRVARLLAAGHGGQILVSQMTQTLVGDALSPAVSFRDLGIRRLKDLAAPEHIWQVVAPDLPATFPPLKTLDVRPSNLPIQLLPLLGRTAEVTQAEAKLIHDRARILTLTGPGGIGKTRLAQELGHMLQDRYPDGVVMVDLAPVTDSALVLPTLAQTLGVPVAGDHPLVARLHAYLHDLRLLLILDNLEHLLVVVPEIMALIQSTRHVQILVTSREPLQVRGEVLLVLSPFPVPAATPSLSVEEALTLPVVRLFCDRAQAVVPTFQLTSTELPAVLDLCRRLDGVPLAIELTAAGIRIMSPTNLVAHLDRGLDGVLRQGRDRPSRHQTLRQTIAWSYDLLTLAEQRLFAHLAVFEGGWTVEAAEAVCADPTLPAPHILTLLDAVVMKSLVQRMPIEDGEEPRFQMLTTIRTYAEECLERQPERARIHQQHLQYYAALTDSQRGHYVGATQITHLNCLEAEPTSITTGRPLPGRCRREREQPA
jgi:predicted ATPase/class 3 adenylate cyclase